MHNNTPPHKQFDDDEPIGEQADQDGLVAEDDDELVYVGDADEVLTRWEAELAAEDAEDDDDGDADDDDREPLRDDSELTFSRHTAAVFCGELHPTRKLAVTGGEDDRAYVWSTETGDVVHEITSHNDTIVGAAFSPDGNYLAIGDMAGELEVLKVASDYQRVWEFSMGDMSWMRWHCATNVLMAGGASGEVYVWRIPSGECKVLAGNGHQSECGELTADGKRLIVGYADGSVRLWDIKNSTCVQHIEYGSPLAHTEPVTCIAADPANGVFITGGVDGVVLISSAASGAISRLEPAAGAIEGLAWCPDAQSKLMACGTLEGRVSLWDVGHQAVRVECERTDDRTGVTRLSWASNQNLLVSTLGGTVNVFDGRSGQLKRTLLGHRAEIYEMNYSRSRGQLLTMSDDHTAKLFALTFA